MQSFKDKNLPTVDKLISTKLKLLITVLLAVSLGIFSCEGPVGPEGPPGPPGPTGAVGPAGADGNLMHAGDGPPESGLGDPGDFYLDLTTGDLYGPKDNQGWGSPVNLSGADGQDGQNGQDGSQIHAGDGPPDAELGDEGDYYLDKANFQLYGPKSVDDWGEPINLQGPEGESGADGISGWVRVVSSEEISGGGSFKSIEIQCPVGKNVLGGGGRVTSNTLNFPSHEIIMNGSGPVTDTSWRVLMTNNSSFNGTMTAYAICANTN